MNLDNYIYQYDLDGFPLPRVIDIARRMKYHHYKLWKKCANCSGETINKPNHKFCVDCMISHYIRNKSITEFFPQKVVIP